MPRRRQKDQPDYYCLLSMCVCVRARTSVRAYVFFFFVYVCMCVCTLRERGRELVHARVCMLACGPAGVRAGVCGLGACVYG